MAEPAVKDPPGWLVPAGGVVALFGLVIGGSDGDWALALLVAAFGLAIATLGSYSSVRRRFPGREPWCAVAGAGLLTLVFLVLLIGAATGALPETRRFPTGRTVVFGVGGTLLFGLWTAMSVRRALGASPLDSG